MPNQSRASPIGTKPSENQNASHCHTSPSPQDHLTSNAAPVSPNSNRQNAQMQPAHVLDPAIAKFRQLEDQLSKAKEEGLATEKQNIQLRQQDLELQGQILLEHGKTADLREQLFNVQERCKHLERNAERHKFELPRFKAAVTKGLDEASLTRGRIDERYYSDLNTALRVRKESLQNCDHQIAAAIDKLQDGNARSDDVVRTPAEPLQEVPQQGRLIVDEDSSSGANLGDRSAGTCASTAKMVEKEQSAGTAASPPAADIGSRKRGMDVEPSGETITGERGMMKKVKTAKQNSPQHGEETFGQTYPNIESLLGKDDATFQKTLERLGPNNPRSLDGSSREPLKRSGAKEGRGRRESRF